MFKHRSQPAVQVVAFVDEGLGNSSHLVDLGDGSALVVDPVRDPTAYLAEAERRSLRIRAAIDTHLHADFVSGGRELAADGATFIAPAAADLAYPYRGVRHQEEIDLGGLVVRPLATPGHTPEHMSYLLLDDGSPVAVFTGGAVIVGSIARTDLVSADRTETLTREAYRSVREQLGPLPDELPVYPTHGGGSFCSVSGSSDRTTTVARERRTNPVFTIEDEDTFVATFLSSLGSFPPYFLRTRAINQRGVELGAHRRTLARLDARRVNELLGKGAVVVDARPFESFARGHIRNSLSIELRPQFASWVGWVVPHDVPIVLILDDDQDRADAMRQCLKIGYDTIAGELDGGVRTWAEAGYELSTFDLVEAGDRSGALVDVRQRSELGTGMIPGAHHAEAGSVDAGSLPSGPLTLYCGHGQRGATAASLLERAGRHDLGVLVGGPQDWRAATGEALHRSA
jgi:glyoxylase-like metal-dependent hydrolase (beta-lactamase superfamily II)